MITFERVLEKFTPRLKGIAHRIYTCSPSVSSDDLMQEAAVHLWMEYKQGNLYDKTDSYILQGCYFHLKNFVRTIKGRNRLISIDEHAGEAGEYPESLLWKRDREAAADYLEYLNDRMLADVIRNNGLTAKEKELLPFLSQGLTTREIGAKLGVSHVRVIKLTRAIREKCRTYLD
jgi:RNA polymerase sigma factor (sigma-70 family)